MPTRRQQQYLALIAQGWTQKQISAELRVGSAAVSKMIGRLTEYREQRLGCEKPELPPRSIGRPSDFQLDRYSLLLLQGLDRRIMADQCGVSVSTTFRWIPGLSGRPGGGGKRKATPVDRSTVIRQREAEKRLRLIAEMRA